MPRVDVVVVASNSGDLLIECVRSILASTVQIRVFLVDNASTDGSIERLAHALPDCTGLQLFRNASNLGFAAGVNRALPLCDSDYVLLLNPDCVVQPATLEQMLAIAEEQKNAGMFGCMIRNSDGSEQVGCRRFIPTPAKALMRVLHFRHGGFDLTGRQLPAEPCEVEAISGAFMLVRRAALIEVGPLDDGYFLHCEDLDWCLRFKLAGYGIVFVPGVEVWHAKGSSSAGRSVFVEKHKHAGMLRFYRKFFRQQYPILLWWLVWIAVWGRFWLKAGWISVRRLAGLASG